LIEITQFMAQRSEDIGNIKEGVQKAGRRLSEIYRTVQTNQQRIEIQAGHNHAELLLIMSNQFSRLEKAKQSKNFSAL
jgi:hypothetical protein